MEYEWLWVYILSFPTKSNLLYTFKNVLKCSTIYSYLILQELTTTNEEYSSHF